MEVAAMANVWFCWEGDSPTTGGPIAVQTLPSAVPSITSERGTCSSGDAMKVRFGPPNDFLASIRGYEHVVAELAADRAKSVGWKQGHYHSALTPEEVLRVLGR
jgi:hypothetical protein